MFSDAFPIISTPYLKRALDFYRDLLDAEVEYQFPPDGEPGYVGLRIGTPLSSPGPGPRTRGCGADLRRSS